MPSFTNINDLEKHLKDLYRGMFKSKEMTEAGKNASRTMGRYVEDEVSAGGDSGYDYWQSGDFHSLIANESKYGKIYQTPSSLLMGSGDLDYFSDKGSYGSMRNYQTQTHMVHGRPFTFTLKQEDQMPKWIIAEFGSGQYGTNLGVIPKQFRINYTPRPEKEYMFGPSLGNVSGEGGGSKKGYFMVSGSSLMNLLGKKAENRRNFKNHPGVRAGHVFSRGLENSRKEVLNELSDGIKLYLDSH